MSSLFLCHVRTREEGPRPEPRGPPGLRVHARHLSCPSRVSPTATEKAASPSPCGVSALPAPRLPPAPASSPGFSLTGAQGTGKDDGSSEQTTSSDHLLSPKVGLLPASVSPGRETGTSLRSHDLPHCGPALHWGPGVNGAINPKRKYTRWPRSACPPQRVTSSLLGNLTAPFRTSEKSDFEGQGTNGKGASQRWLESRKRDSSPLKDLGLC